MQGKEYMIRNEIAILTKVSRGHRNILTMVDYFETVNNRKIPFLSLFIILF